MFKWKRLQKSQHEQQKAKTSNQFPNENQALVS